MNLFVCMRESLDMVASQSDEGIITEAGLML